MSVDTDVFHNTVLNLMTYDGKNDMTSVKVKLTPALAVSLLRDLPGHVLGSLVDVADAYRRGDCDTCGNRRLVDVQGTGRKTNAYCPDCNADGNRSGPLAAYPKLRQPGPKEVP